MKKVLIPTKLNRVAADLLQKHGGYQVVQDEEQGLAELVAAHPDVYALIVRSEKVTADMIDQLPKLKVIIRAGAGYNTIDTKYARKKGIDVMNTPGANANAVAEEVVALMLADARHIIQADRSAREGKWEKKKFMGREVSGKTVGIVGLGFIGRTVAKRLSGFEVTLLGFDPVISEERAQDMGMELVSLQELFEKSDYVTLHVPENDQTRGMVNAELLGSMKEGATIINCARAGIVNEDDLRQVRATKTIRFLNDVYPKDEDGPKSVADVADIMLPHLGASTQEANINAATRAADQLIEFDDKGITTYIVNRDIPEGLDEAFGELAHTLAKLCRCVVGQKAQLKLIETSFYGTLKPYADWLIIPIVAALNKEFDRSLDFNAARQYLKDMGVDYNNRETDDAKGFENSITIDLTASSGQDNLRHASVRGTVAENTLMISRINDFDKLYFEPRGHIAYFSYCDRPGVLGRIAATLAEAEVNIDDVRNPHNLKGDCSVAILKVNQPVSQSVVDKIAKEIDAKSAFYVEL